MTNVPLEDLIKKVGSIYKLTILIAMRTLELSEGAESLIKDKKFSRLSDIVAQEIQEGKITFKETKKK